MYIETKRDDFIQNKVCFNKQLNLIFIHPPITHHHHRRRRQKKISSKLKQFKVLH